jgi:hypothetical protein
MLGQVFETILWSVTGPKEMGQLLGATIGKSIEVPSSFFISVRGPSNMRDHITQDPQDATLPVGVLDHTTPTVTAVTI